MISVVIPAYNEAERIRETVEAARSIPGVVQVVVVDDGSRDGTGALAREAGGEVVTLAENQGKGEALTAGIARATGQIILLLDADLGTSAAQAQALVIPLLGGRVDMTVASFPRTKRPAGLGLTMALARYGTWALTGLSLTAPLSGQRAFTKKALQTLSPLLPGFGVEVGFNIRAVRRGLRIQEVPLNMEHTVTGWDLRGFRHRARQFWHILLALTRLMREK